MHDRPVDDEEPLARFVLDKAYYRPSDQTIKHNAFMPSKTRDVSVFRTLNLSNDEALGLGHEFVAKPRQKELLGYASLKASSVRQVALDVSGTELPHPRHANIAGWPGGTEDRLLAIKLAAVALLKLV